MAEDTAVFTMQGLEAVTVAWLPTAQTVTDTLNATFYLVISNTGTVGTQYDLELALGQLVSGTMSHETVYLPAHVGTDVVVAVMAPGEGVYDVGGTAVSPNNSSATATATLTVTSAVDPPPPPEGLVVYLPIIIKNN